MASPLRSIDSWAACSAATGFPQRAVECERQLLGGAIVDVPLTGDYHRHAAGQERSRDADDAFTARDRAGGGAARSEDHDTRVWKAQSREVVRIERLAGLRLIGEHQPRQQRKLRVDQRVAAEVDDVEARSGLDEPLLGGGAANHDLAPRIQRRGGGGLCLCSRQGANRFSSGVADHQRRLQWRPRAGGRRGQRIDEEARAG
jgi:hypothetical protein